MEQRSIDWYEWRKQGLGASDAPVVMGVSPWKTPFKLWHEKTGRITTNEGNWATQRGNELEPKARAYFEFIIKMDFPPVLAQHKDFPFMRASLDGFNEENKFILEIKCPGIDDHNKAANKEIPDKYYPQLQHQLFVTGAVKLFYFSFHIDKNEVATGHIVEVFPDKAYMKKLFNAMTKFWLCVKNDIEPELTDRDYKTVRNSKLNELLLAWKQTSDNIAILESRLESLKSEILNFDGVVGNRIKCGNFQIGMITRKGNVQYKDIPELKSVDLEKYRAKSTSYQFIKFKDKDQDD